LAPWPIRNRGTHTIADQADAAKHKMARNDFIDTRLHREINMEAGV